MTAIAEHADIRRTARRVQEDTATAIPAALLRASSWLRAAPQAGTTGASIT
jgi:hypothetical protein